jgi:hypothetical protein
LQYALNAELARWPDWVIYVQEDERVPSREVIRVMDIVRAEEASDSEDGESSSNLGRTS